PRGHTADSAPFRPTTPSRPTPFRLFAERIPLVTACRTWYPQPKTSRAGFFMKGSSVNPGSSVPGSTSSSLLAGLRTQERAAWSRLAKLYGPLVYSWCRRRGLQDSDAADVLQEVFRAVAGKIEDYAQGPGSTFRGWLWTITRN